MTWHMNKSPEIILTEDGSHSLVSADFGVSYHSTHGAITESKHVFVESALRPKIAQQSHIDILEIGFGTGLNAFLTYLVALNEPIQVNYVGVEAYPIDLTIAKTLNYASLLNAANEEDAFMALHSNSSNQSSAIKPNFQFEKRVCTFNQIEADNIFDIVYFDAFSPNEQPELWGIELLSMMYKALRPQGIFVTYCAKGEVRRTLQALGFTVERLAGPPGKREMLRATK